MRVTTLASSSSGNCTLVSEGDTHILIDAGISCRRITDGLRLQGLSPCDLAAVVVTHAHTDHTNGLRVLCKNARTRVIAPPSPLSSICGLFAAGTEAEEISPGHSFDIRGLEVCAFRTSHDSPDSVGYTITYGGRKLAFATDLGVVTAEVSAAIRGADLAIIESNHDITMLKYGSYPPSLKRRVLSDVGHLSNLACGALAVELVQSGTTKLVLAHLSRENNTPQLALQEVGGALASAGIAVGRDVDLSAAPQFCVGETMGV